jgi:hypothetical protein
MRMPPAQLDPERLLALGAALAPLRESALAGADEVLGHYPEVGDRETQSALEDYLDQAADLLREIDASATDLADRLRAAAASGSAVERAVAQRIDESGEVRR